MFFFRTPQMKFSVYSKQLSWLKYSNHRPLISKQCCCSKTRENPKSLDYKHIINLTREIPNLSLPNLECTQIQIDVKLNEYFDRDVQTKSTTCACALDVL